MIRPRVPGQVLPLVAGLPAARAVLPPAAVRVSALRLPPLPRRDALLAQLMAGEDRWVILNRWACG